MALVAKYQDHRMADRVFEVAATHSRAILGHLGASEAQAQHFGQLASAVIFANGAYRASSGILRRNRKGQSGLWGYAISGDLPIVLLRVSDADNLRLVRDLLTAHAYWRMRGLLTDLVIWNEDVSGYRRMLNDQILGLIAAGTEAQLVDKPGGVFVRHVDTSPKRTACCCRRWRGSSSGMSTVRSNSSWSAGGEASVPPAGLLLTPPRVGAAAGGRAVPPRRET